MRKKERGNERMQANIYKNCYYVTILTEHYQVRAMSVSLYENENELLRKNERENETTFIVSMSMHGSQRDLNYFALNAYVKLL